MPSDKVKPKKDKETPLIVEAFNFKNIGVKQEIHSSWKNFNWKIMSKNLILIFMGAFLTTTSFYFLINRAGLYTNGLSAFAQFFAKLIAAPYTDLGEKEQVQVLWFYPMFAAINIPIIIWGFLKVGLRFTIYTIIYMGFQLGINWLLTLTPDSFQILGNQSEPLARTFIFAALAGLIYGAGIGILFKTGGSSGGMDFISTYISMKRKYSIATIIRNTNIIIVIVVLMLDGIFIQHNSFIDNILTKPYFIATIVYIYVSAFIMNRVYPKYMLMTVFIISIELEQIRNDIYRNNYLRGGNVWNVKGLYSANEYKMMMTTMSLLEYNFFKSKIVEIDPKVFMVVLPAKYMHGGNAGKPPQNVPVNIAEINDFLEKN
ncbi:YitT family protein [Spiroplasma endosymbiont of Virgichneumon dumeticola]|uniref:YitT family protein n=1 Tax=Spiroplasma endosymbiont of Virgichneumon dumeticola TaxID=3139323 RepID=UPI0035C911BC